MEKPPPTPKTEMASNTSQQPSLLPKDGWFYLSPLFLRWCCFPLISGGAAQNANTLTLEKVILGCSTRYPKVSATEERRVVFFFEKKKKKRKTGGEKNPCPVGLLASGRVGRLRLRSIQDTGQFDAIFSSNHGKLDLGLLVIRTAGHGYRRRQGMPCGRLWQWDSRRVILGGRFAASHLQVLSLRHQGVVDTKTTT